MKSLPNVTLISYDNTDKPERTLRVLQHCASMIQFSAVVLVCRVIPQGVNGETIQRVSERGYAAAMIWEVAGVRGHVATDYALCVHHDGYIVRPDQWRDYWLDYDFTGAPWPGQPHAAHPGKSDNIGRVGNSGFCLKSRAFMERTAEMKKEFIRSAAHPDQYGQAWGADTFCSQHQRSNLESKGIRFAPIDIAAGFSWESNIEEYPNGRPDAFGFHNFNLENKKVPRV